MDIGSVKLSDFTSQIPQFVTRVSFCKMRFQSAQIANLFNFLQVEISAMQLEQMLQIIQIRQMQI